MRLHLNPNRNRMKVAIITLTSPALKVGAGEYLRNLLLHLPEVDSSNDYYVFTVPDTRHLFPLGGEKIHEVTVKLPRRGKLLYPLLRTLWLHSFFLLRCRRLGIDVIHIPNTQLMLWRKPATVVSIFDLREFHMPHSTYLRTWYRRIANTSQARLAASIQTLSKNSAKDIQRFLGAPEDKITVTYLAADRFHKPIFNKKEKRRLLQERYGIDGDFILSVASAMRHKNLEAIVRAAALFKEEQELPWKIVFAGKYGDALDDLRLTAVELDINKEIIFTGYVSDKDLEILYATASFFVFPSLWEGFGLPVLEAMAAGCPVLCSNVASLPEVAGDAALFFDPKSTEELAGIMRTLSADKELAARMREDGFNQAKKFSYREMARKTVLQYAETFAAKEKKP